MAILDGSKGSILGHSQTSLDNSGASDKHSAIFYLSQLLLKCGPDVYLPTPEE